MKEDLRYGGILFVSSNREIAKDQISTWGRNGRRRRRTLIKKEERVMDGGSGKTSKECGFL